MANYKKMYKTLFNAVTDAIEHLHYGNVLNAEVVLKQAQLDCEEIYLQTVDNVTILPSAKEPKEQEED